MLSKDTHPERLRERVQKLALERGIGEDEIARFKYGSTTDAAKFGEFVILSVYFPRLAHILKELQNDGITLSGKVVIDTMNPLNVDANFNHYHDLKYMERTSITKEVQRAFPEAIFFKAFNSMPATLLEVQKWSSGRVPPIIFIGGNASSVGAVRKLIEDTGFKPQFAGYDLNRSGLLERMGILLHLLVENEYEGNVNVVFDVMEWKA
jgi:predicted dinucleotide-binding enzyme